MNRLHTSLSLALGFLLAGLLSGCGSKSPPSASNVPAHAVLAVDAKVPLPEPPYVAPCEPGVRGGRLVVASFGDPKSFNPITANESSSLDILRFLFAGLLNVDAIHQTVLPGLADQWSVAPDKKTWTFHLRKGLRWSDGEPLNADDVLFTWKDVIYNTNIVNVVVDQFRIDGKDFDIRKIDDYTVQVVTPEIYAPFLLFFGQVPIIPGHILFQAVREHRFEAAYGINTPPADLVGSGPFRLKEYKPGQYALLERNPAFWEVDTNGQRLPYLDNVLYSVVPDQNTMSLRFLHGETDLLELVRPEEYEHFKDESASGRFRLLDLGLASEHDMLTFNQNTGTNATTGKPYVDPVKLKWFRETKFRQAISYAIDRDAIVKVALGGHGAPNYSFAPVENKTWFNSNIMTFPHDLAKARALLAEIGIKPGPDGKLADADGHPIAFVMNSNSGNDRRNKTGNIIQQDLKDLGIDLTFQSLEFNVLVNKSNNTFDYNCILLGWAGGSPDPVYGMNILKSDGFSHDWFPRQKSPSTPWEARIDELMNAQLKTLDQVERKKFYDEVQLILSQQMAMIPTASMEAYSAARSNLGNLRGTTMDANRLIWNIEELYFKK